MGELSTVGAELLAELETDAPEALRTAVVLAVGESAITCRVIPDSLTLIEAEGESVKVTDAVFLVFVHQVPTAPQADDTITIDGRVYQVIEGAQADPASVMWRVIARA